VTRLPVITVHGEVVVTGGKDIQDDETYDPLVFGDRWPAVASGVA